MRVVCLLLCCLVCLVNDRAGHACVLYTSSAGDWMICTGGESDDRRLDKTRRAGLHFNHQASASKHEIGLRVRAHSNRVFALRLPNFEWKELQMDERPSHWLWRVLLSPRVDYNVSELFWNNIVPNMSPEIIEIPTAQPIIALSSPSAGIIFDEYLVIATGTCAFLSLTDVRGAVRNIKNDYEIRYPSRFVPAQSEDVSDWVMNHHQQVGPAVINLSRIDWQLDTPLFVVEGGDHPPALYLDTSRREFQAMGQPGAHQFIGVACAQFPGME